MIEELCSHCRQRPGTENWSGTMSQLEIARNPQYLVKWCHRCVVEVQLAYSRYQASRIPDLEKELARYARST